MRIDLAQAEFTRLRVLLEGAAGLVFDDSRRDSLSYSLAERLRATGTASLAEYLDHVSSPAASIELQALLNEVTIQETHFFRNPPQFRALRQHVLPGLVRRAALGERKLRVWSAGCSTGEEPFSVAMLLREQLPLTDGWDIEILATDVSTRALEAAQDARYGARALAVAEADDVARWFTRYNEDYVVRPEIRELVTFRHHNLVTEPPPFEPGEVDLILCRNVTIYFGKDTTRRLVQQFHDSLNEGGYFFIGHSETLWQVSDQFRLVTLGDAFVYRREAPGVVEGPERRTVLPDRRTGDDGLPAKTDRRLARQDRRGAWELLTKTRTLSFPKLRDKTAEPGAESAVEPSAAVATATPMDALDEVRAALQAARYDDAVALAAAVTSAEPLRADAHYLHGLALANLGRDAAALIELRKSVYVDPSIGFAHFLLGGVLTRLGDTEAAARSYRNAAETLARGGSDSTAAELGGRSVEELVELCWQLAGGRRG